MTAPLNSYIFDGQDVVCQLSKLELVSDENHQPILQYATDHTVEGVEVEGGEVKREEGGGRNGRGRGQKYSDMIIAERLSARHQILLHACVAFVCM